MKKLLLLFAASTFAVANFAQCSDLYFSEYIEGSSNNKAIEIYNPTNFPVDLSTYSVVRYTNGASSASNTLNLVGTLNAGSVYVIGNTSSQLHADITAQADTTHSVCGFNGDDALSLFNGTAQIDVIGLIGTDPGSSWGVGTGSTKDYTLVRKVTINTGNTTWIGSGDTEWDVYTQDDFSLLGIHTTNGCGPQSTDPIISFDGSSVSVNEGVGTVTVNLILTNSSSVATSVDVVLNASSTVGASDYSFANPTTVTFPANSTTSQMISVSIIDDIDVETAELLILELQNFTNNATAGPNAIYEVEITDNDEAVIPGCSELYFSEYIEGSSSNKAIEIYNPTASAVDLSNYSVYLYGNGATIATDTLMLTGTINAGDVFIIASPNADSANIIAVSDTLHSVCYFNGDDALSLFNGTAQVDVIGLIGTDPGSLWSVDTGATREYTLVRKPSIVNGTTLWSGVGDTQWIAYSQDDFSFLGSHTTDGCQSAAPLEASFALSITDTVCLGTSFNYTGMVSGGTAPYSVLVNFNDGNTSNTMSGSHTYATAGLYDIVFTVMDDAIPSQQVDTIITVAVENCSSINEELENSIKLFPNPTKNGIVNFTNVSMNSTVTIYNVIGKVVYKNIIDVNEQLDLSNLNKGSYFVSIATDNNTVTKKLIIE